MSGQAATRSPKLDDQSPTGEPLQSAHTGFCRWLQIWEQIMIAEILRALEQRKVD